MIWPLHPAFVRNVIYPVYRGLRGDRVLETLAELERNQWLTREELEDIQWRRLHHLLEGITTHVPFYRTLFADHGLRVEDIQNYDDFRKVPLLTKGIIRAECARLTSRDPFRKGYASSTGGSTGEPLYFFCDRAVGPLRRANTLRGNRWTGIDVGARQAMFWGVHLDVTFGERFVNAVKYYFNNIIYLSTFDMSPASLLRYTKRLRRYRPELVVGYPSALTTLAEFCSSRSVHIPRPKAVVTSGERLYPEQREKIEAVLGSPVFDRYGSREFANVAHECDEHKGLHVFSDLFFVEVVTESGRPARPGEVGEVVVTDLFNLYMPFVRYRTGDLAVPSERTCSCGRGLPLLERIEGRSFDTIVTPSGKSVGGFFWTWLSRAVPGIERFQIEQRDRSGIIFRIVPGPAWSDEFTHRLEAMIKENCGEEFRVKFMLVDDISLSPSGKSRFIIARIEEREVIKSKVHKAHVTAEDPDRMDCLVIDEELMDRGDIMHYERILIVDNTNGARVETFAAKGGRGSGIIMAGGAVSKHIHAGDEISIMAFTWSDGTAGSFRNLLVDENNRFVRYMTDVASERL